MRPEDRLAECPRCLDAGAYALHALEDLAAQEFAAHLSECSVCSAELADVRLVVDLLPVTVPQVAAPLALKQRIMAVVESESQLLRAAGPQADRPSRAEPRTRSRWAGLTSSLRPAWAGALACGLLALGVAGGTLVAGRSDAPADRYQPAWVQGRATAKLHLRGDQASLEVVNLPSLPRGRVYQVWLDRGDGTPRPTRTLFDVPSDGRTRVTIDESVRGVKKIVVTAEPSGGAQTPSGSPVITAALA